MVSVDSGNLIWYDYVMLISWSTSNGVKAGNLTFNENKALGEWVCGFNERRASDDEG